MNIEDPVFPLERNLYGHPFAGLLWVHLSIENKNYFLSAYIADIKTDGKKQNMGPMWKKLMKNVDLGEPTLFHDHVYAGFTQCECEPNETGIEQYKKMLETRNSAGPTQDGKHFSKKQLRGPMTWKDLLKNAVGYCELAKKKTEQL